MLRNPYTQAVFLKSAAKLTHLPEDTGIEVAFAGRSNAGKSTALNTLTQNKRLARTSKTPGRTQLINLFTLDESRRLVDLPGYGYAKVPESVKRDWQQLLARYLETRTCLKGLVLLMDCRHPLTELDQMLIDFTVRTDLSLHVLLNKADKISKSALKQTGMKVEAHLRSRHIDFSVQPFSSLNKIGLEALIEKLNEWFEFSE